MDIISNLKQSHKAEGLTPEKLKRLEQVFQDTVGDNKEIDLDNFKKIVQSKNMFFVERIFRIFDADNSGSVSLDEFMGVMHRLAKQSSAEKLKYLFEVYDLNDDGSIQFSELRNVISECMKENGLAFKESEIDELTTMLFEDADTDGSGTITFTEFKDQLERHPAFMENLTLSIERWMLPNIKPQQRDSMMSRLKPHQLSWKHIRNNWTSVVFLISYFLVNVALFSTKAWQYRHSNVYVIVARACGQCLNFNCAFNVVLVLRQTLTWLRTHGYAQYFPIDQHLYYHKITGYCIFGYSVLHTLMHVANFSIMSQQSGIPLLEHLFSTKLGIGWVEGSACLTGWMLLTILTIMIVSAMSFVRRSGNFEVFYCLHMLYFAFWICLILHGPSFWKWFLAPAVIYLMEAAIRMNRNLSSSKVAYVQQGVLLPSKVTHLVIKRPPKFEYRPGDYVYINIPSIAKFEWHPFTISSAPELDDTLWLHIRGVGEWTNSLYRYFEREDREAILSDELAKVFEMSALENQQKNASCGEDTNSVVSNQSSKPQAIRSASESSSYLNHTFIVSNNCISRSSVNTVIEMELNATPSPKGVGGLSSPKSGFLTPNRGTRRRTSFSSTSTSRVIQNKNKKDLKTILAERKQNVGELDNSALLRPPSSRGPKEKRRSVRISVAEKGPHRCQTVIIMPTVNEDEDEEDVRNSAENEMQKDNDNELEKEIGGENVVVAQNTLKIFLDGPYGSPTRHIFQARHAVLIATGIGVTPFASILQSIMYQYRKSRHECPNCKHNWCDPMPVSSVRLKKVDFIWLNRHQRAFEWFVTLLSELEVEQAQMQDKDRFLDIHMYITSALDRTDMKAVGLQMALDLLYKKEKRCLITGLKSRTQPGRPDWQKVFTSIANQKKGKVTVFFCGPDQLAKTLHTRCNEFGFRFRKESF